MEATHRLFLMSKSRRINSFVSVRLLQDILQLQGVSGMTRLSSCVLVCFLSQIAGFGLFVALAGGRFAAVVAVLCQAGFEFLNPCQQVGVLLLQGDNALLLEGNSRPQGLEKCVD